MVLLCYDKNHYSEEIINVYIHTISDIRTKEVLDTENTRGMGQGWWFVVGPSSWWWSRPRPGYSSPLGWGSPSWPASSSPSASSASSPGGTRGERGGKTRRGEEAVQWNNTEPLLFRGIAGNAALVAALGQSFAQQTQFLTNTFQIDQGGAGETECLTCSLIQMGSSMAYGDNSCPQCGAKCEVWVGAVSSEQVMGNSSLLSGVSSFKSFSFAKYIDIDIQNEHCHISSQYKHKCFIYFQEWKNISKM